MSEIYVDSLASWELEHISGIQSAVDEGDAAMFRMARRVAEARAAGMTQQRIADNIRKPNGDTYSQRWVSYVERAFQNHDSSPDDSWAECWNRALGRGKPKEDGGGTSDPRDDYHQHLTWWEAIEDYCKRIGGGIEETGDSRLVDLAREHLVRVENRLSVLRQVLDGGSISEEVEDWLRGEML